MRSSFAFLNCLLLVSLTAQVHGQGRTITGTVLDTASSRPLPVVEVYLYHTSTGERSGKDGKFRVKNAGVGDTIVMLRRGGYVPIRTSLAGTLGNAVDLGTLYLRPVAGDTDQVAVDAFDLLVYPQLASFYRRRREIPQAYYFTRDEIERSGGRRASEVLRRNRALQNVCLKATPRPSSTDASPGATMYAESQSGDVDCGETAKRGTTYSGFRSGQTAPCGLEGYVNGRRSQLPLDDVQLKDILAIEVYPLASMTPREFGEGRCGAVVVWADGGAGVAGTTAEACPAPWCVGCGAR